MISNESLKRAAFSTAVLVVSNVALYYGLKYLIDHPLGQGKEREEIAAKSLQALEKMGHKNLKLNEHETAIASEIIHPDDIHVTFSDIGGLDHIISSLRETIIYPLLYPNLFNNSSILAGAPKGVLLFGPPGCGKTMLAKALAKESGATFINVAISALANKWFGESNKLVAGLFSLAQKTQPCIIFIDEIDSFLRERTKGDHEATAMMKAEFMTLWDGLLSSKERIMVLGATNRPNDIDSAILRRMPKRFAVRLPDTSQRKRILTLVHIPLLPISPDVLSVVMQMLRETELEVDFPLDDLAQRTDGLSGSDLKELCRNAAMSPVREYMKRMEGDPTALTKMRSKDLKLRPLSLEDFFKDEATELLLLPNAAKAEIANQAEEFHDAPDSDTP
ncbi:AAA-domain-containing protein [Thelephora ganbajun]|uniref:AAA-domain-containing protein n=1 Tax=Thelephora ganbajun TaxID=370292 RepID=A0ACB6ZB44_THEGA|nr:AAA-domain-containing protein [Thelephora ganbajun]